MTELNSTHALIIGTSKYAYLPNAHGEIRSFNLKPMQSPALGAFEFYKWLTNEYNNPAAPKVNAQILLSMSDAELAGLSNEDKSSIAKIDSPTLANVRKALLQWYRDCRQDTKDVAILYLSGHGISLDPTENYLLLHDFAQDELCLDYAVNLERVHQALAAPDAAQTQFYFYDACRNEIALGHQEFLGNGLGLPRNSLGFAPDNRVAPIFRSTTANAAALGLPKQGTVFSTSLMACLRGKVDKAVVANQALKLVSSDTLRVGLVQEVAKKAIEVGKEAWVTCDNIGRSECFHVLFPPKVNLAPEVAHADGANADGLPALVESLGIIPSNLLNRETGRADSLSKFISKSDSTVSFDQLEKIFDDEEDERRRPKKPNLETKPELKRDSVGSAGSRKSAARPTSAHKGFPRAVGAKRSPGAAKAARGTSPLPPIRLDVSKVTKKPHRDEQEDESEENVHDKVPITMDGKKIIFQIEQKQNLIGEFEGRDWWLWSVWIKASAQGMKAIKSVTWELHDSFPESLRKQTMTDASNQFALEQAAWGEFCIYATVELKNRKKPLTIRHWLQLEYPDGSRTDL